MLETALGVFADRIKKTTGADVSKIAGGGAAGGMGAGLAALAGAKIVSGAKTVNRFTGLEGCIKRSGVVVTGEGAVDSQTFSGKAVSEVIRFCKKYGKPLFCLTASVAPGTKKLKDVEFLNITPSKMSKKESMERGGELLEKAGRRLGKELSQFRV